MTLISTPEDLSAVCRRLATQPFVTVDTEFLLVKILKLFGILQN
jgi:ribonuclease D